MRCEKILVLVLALLAPACASGDAEDEYGSPGESALTEDYLPPLESDAGIVAHMLLAETLNPGYRSYDAEEVYTSMFAMRAVVDNRLRHGPAIFNARGATDYQDIVTARGQWEGFTRDAEGRTLISASVKERIDHLVRLGTTTEGKYADYLDHALHVAEAPVDDPFVEITEIDGTPVESGAYGWRTAGASHPGGSFVKLPTGLLSGNQFYTIKR